PVFVTVISHRVVSAKLLLQDVTCSSTKTGVTRRVSGKLRSNSCDTRKRIVHIGFPVGVPVSVDVMNRSFEVVVELRFPHADTCIAERHAYLSVDFNGSCQRWSLNIHHLVGDSNPSSGWCKGYFIKVITPELSYPSVFFILTCINTVYPFFYLFCLTVHF